jgi:hypothetical protein
MIFCVEKAERLTSWITALSMTKNERTWIESPELLAPFMRDINAHVVEIYNGRAISQQSEPQRSSNTSLNENESSKTKPSSKGFSFKRRPSTKSRESNESTTSSERGLKFKKRPSATTRITSNTSSNSSKTASIEDKRVPESDDGYLRKGKLKPPLLNYKRAGDKITIESNEPIDKKEVIRVIKHGPLVDITGVTNCKSCGCSELRSTVLSKICRSCFHNHAL